MARGASPAAGALPELSPSDEVAAEAYFSELLTLYLEAHPDVRDTATEPPSLDVRARRPQARSAPNP